MKKSIKDYHKELKKKRFIIIKDKKRTIEEYKALINLLYNLAKSYELCSDFTVPDFVRYELKKLEEDLSIDFPALCIYDLL